MATLSQDRSPQKSGERVKRIKELDGLRAIAILLVIGCHYQGFARLLWGAPEFGWIGVDIFFALSGYLITSILLDLRNKKHPYTTFYSRRAIRIIPPYAASTFVVIAAGVLHHSYIVLSPGFLLSQAFFLQAFSLSHFTFIQAWLTHPLQQLFSLPHLMQGAHHLSPGMPGLLPTLLGASGTYWSLSIEEYFYLLWAPIVLRLPRAWILVVALVICGAEILLRWSFAEPGAYFGLIFRFDALIYGALLALGLEAWESRTIQIRRYLGVFLALSVCGLSAIFILLSPIISREIRESPLFLAFGLPLISIGTASLVGILVLRAETDWWLSKMLKWRPLQFIGTISYTMYLVHIIVVLFVLQALMAVGFTQSPNVLLIGAIVSTIGTIGISRLSWRYLERPLLRWKDARFPNPHTAKPTLQ